MIVGVKLEDGRGYNGTLTYSAPAKMGLEVGDRVIVDTLGLARVGVVEAVGRRRTEVGCRFRGKLKKVKRLATDEETIALMNVIKARNAVIRARGKASNAVYALGETLNGRT